MLRELVERIRQGYRTMAYPDGEPVLPDRFRGRPVIDGAACPPDCRACVAACPTGAIGGTDRALTLDMGRCLFCADCAAACPEKALRFTREHRLAAWAREDLVLRDPQPAPQAPSDPVRLSLFRRSLKLRQVSAGGCNACEADVNVLSTIVFDLGRFGIQIVASPRHADGLLITGPVTENMKLALEKTYDALPPPQHRDRRRRLRHLGRAIPRPPRSAQRRRRHRPRGPLHPRLSSPPPDDPGRAPPHHVAGGVDTKMRRNPKRGANRQGRQAHQGSDRRQRWAPQSTKTPRANRRLGR